MDQADTALSLRDQLILAGIAELNKNGVQNFSVRRIAARCGVSCAAPYRHFADKQDFLEAIVEYINGKWDSLQHQIASTMEGKGTRQQLVEVSRGYIRFLVENPHFRSVVMMKLDDPDGRLNAQRGRLSRQTFVLVSRYCREVGMDAEARERKTFAVRSLIYGAALMFDNGELKYTPENLEMVCRSIDREFDLP